MFYFEGRTATLAQHLDNASFLNMLAARHDARTRSRDVEMKKIRKLLKVKKHEKA